MKELKVKFKNCFGIKELSENNDKENDFNKKKPFVFDFEKSNTQLIYAKNGSMKTSFAKIFENYQNGTQEEIKDLACGKKHNHEIIKDSNEISNDEIFVIKPFENTYKEKTDWRNILLRTELKKEYDSIYLDIDKIEKPFLENLFNKSKIPRDLIQKQILEDFKSENFVDAILDQEIKIKKYKIEGLEKIEYSTLFDKKTLEWLEENSNLIENYIKKYRTFLDDTKYLGKDFTLYNAEELEKKIEKTWKYFSEDHLLRMKNKSTGNYDNLTQKEYIDFLEKVRKDLSSDPALKEHLLKLHKSIRNKDKMIFRNYLVNNNDVILSKFKNLDKMKQDFWLSYFKENEVEFQKLTNVYRKKKKELEDIFKKAEDDKGKWGEVLKSFKERFYPPFDIDIDNMVDIITKQEEPILKFYFNDCSKVEQDKNNLVKDILSQGEARIFYLLQVYFDIENLKEYVGSNPEKEILFIIDDIADSFDYKNKYAIVQYLQEISEEPNFYSIILTHNFDFFRTVKSRLNINYKNSFTVKKDDKKLVLENIEKQHLLDPFSEWKKDLSKIKNIIPLISFIRNLVEYKEGNKSDNFKKLTSLLHKKEDTEKIKFAEINEIFTDYIGKNIDNKYISKTFYKEIFLLDIKEDNLEDKIILAIQIRLRAEEFMIKKINDKKFVNLINGVQTRALFDEIKKEALCSDEELKILDSVNIMTPENIHLNSFMYEPILDMDIIELKKLYNDVNDNLIK